MTSKPQVKPKVEKETKPGNKLMTATDLREVLAEQINGLRNKGATKEDIKRASVIVSASRTYVDTIRLELDYAKMLNIQPNMPLLIQE